MRASPNVDHVYYNEDCTKVTLILSENHRKLRDDIHSANLFIDRFINWSLYFVCAATLIFAFVYL
jgi:hypothetical protein